MSKKIISLLCLFNLTFFTGCLDEVIQRLCDEIAEANSIAVVVANTPDYTAKKFTVEYANESAQTVVFEECAGDLEDLNGVINHSGNSIEILARMTDDTLKDFFLDAEDNFDDRQFAVTVKISDTCGGLETTIASEALAEPVWSDISDEVSTEQCTIKASAGVLSATHDL